MVDIISIINQVKQGSQPANWRIYHGKNKDPSYLFGIVLLWLVCTLVSVYAGFLAVLVLLCVGLPIVVFWPKIASHLSQGVQPLLVILPERVVQCDANDFKNAAWLYFPNIDRIELASETRIFGIDGDVSSETHYWLDVYCSDGTYLKWWPDRRFGDAASMGKTIIAAYSYFREQDNFIAYI